jgi:beta-N-acetylhexosaminidase
MSKGLAANGVLGCGKHFPGLGGGMLDSHAATPRIERDWNELWREDLTPYRALGRDLPMVMVNHAAYPRIPQAGSQPASLSPFWIDGVLRKKIGYRGLVISDDMEMGGVMSQAGIETACVAAVAAGTDLLEICRQPDLILRGYETVLREAERSSAFRKRVSLAAARVAAAKRNHLRKDSLGAEPTAAVVSKLKRSIERFTEDVMKAQPR